MISDIIALIVLILIGTFIVTNAPLPVVIILAIWALFSYFGGGRSRTDR